MAIDLEYLTNAYFTTDEPVPYNLKCGKTIEITPVKMSKVMVFVSSYGVLTIDKNQSNDVEVIQMSYLKFISTLMKDKAIMQQMTNICLLCLGFEMPFIRYDDRGRAILSNLRIDHEHESVEELFSITAKEFEDIRRIILYQNIPTYDDAYINPELRTAMDEMDALRAKGIELPSMERRISIITSHTGIPKSEQLKMSLREHSLLFEEVGKEVDYIALKGVASNNGNSDNVQWIYKKSKGKFDDYITSVEQYNKSMGGDGKVNRVSQSGEAFASQYENFTGG